MLFCLFFCLDVFSVDGLQRDGAAAVDAQDHASPHLLKPSDDAQHAADAPQHHDDRAHLKRGLPTMKELLRARHEAEQQTVAVLVEPARIETISGTAHQQYPVARVVESPRQQEHIAYEYAELESRALASAKNMVQQAKAMAGLIKHQKVARAAEFAAANAKIDEWSKINEWSKSTAEAAAATNVVAQRAREGAVTTAAAEARAVAEAKEAALAKAAAASNTAAFRAREKAVAEAAARAKVAAQYEEQQAAVEVAAARAASKRAANAKVTAVHAREEATAEVISASASARVQEAALQRLRRSPPPTDEATLANHASLKDPLMEVFPLEQIVGPRLGDCDCSWAHGSGGASCYNGDDSSRCWRACCSLPGGKTFSISLAVKPQEQQAATTPAYTAKDCKCKWASQGVCAATTDDGSMCWDTCCSRYRSVQQGEQQSIFYGSGGRKYAGSILHNTFRNSTERPPPPPPPMAEALRHAGDPCLDECLGGLGVCPQYCGRQGACCRSDDQVDVLLRVASEGGAACRADDGKRLGCVGGHCCTKSATRVPMLELDNEGVSRHCPVLLLTLSTYILHFELAHMLCAQEACWASCSERAGGCSGFCGSDGACCRRGESGHPDGVACHHGAAGCVNEHCCVHNVVKVRCARGCERAKEQARARRERETGVDGGGALPVPLTVTN